MTTRAAGLVIFVFALLTAGCALSAREVNLDAALRVAPTNATVSPERVGPLHLLVDSPGLTPNWLAQHHYQAGGGLFGDNQALADLWYDGVHRRLLTRSIQLGEVDDPVDIRLGRAEGTYPNILNPDRANDPNTVVGQIGGVMWYGQGNGFGAYTSAIQFRAAGALELSIQDPVTEDLIPQAGLPFTGGFSIYRPGGNVPYDVVTRPLTWSGTDVVARCEANEIVLAGGGSCTAGALRASMPVEGGWRLACTEPGAGNQAAVVCAKR